MTKGLSVRLHTWSYELNCRAIARLQAGKSARFEMEMTAPKVSQVWVAKFSWELDRITDRSMAIKTIIMPILKTLGQLSVRIKIGKGNILLLARKPGEASPP